MPHLFEKTITFILYFRLHLAPNLKLELRATTCFATSSTCFQTHIASGYVSSALSTARILKLLTMKYAAVRLSPTCLTQLESSAVPLKNRVENTMFGKSYGVQRYKLCSNDRLRCHRNVFVVD